MDRMLQQTGIAGMRKEVRERGEKGSRSKGKRKVECVFAESWWSILLPAGYSCKY